MILKEILKELFNIKNEISKIVEHRSFKNLFQL